MVIFENMIEYNSFHLLFQNKIPQPLPPKSTVITTVKLPIQDSHHGFLLFTGIWLFENRHDSLSLRVVPISQFLVFGSWTNMLEVSLSKNLMLKFDVFVHLTIR